MHVLHRKALGLILFAGLGVTLFHVWSQLGISKEVTLPKQDSWLTVGKWITQDNNFHLKEEVACQVPQNVCTCVGNNGGFEIPFSNLLFPRIWAHNFEKAFLESQPDPEGLKRNRAKEYKSFQKRSYTAANVLMVAEANSPLQYPTQGLEVRPLKTLIIPGLALKMNETASTYMVYFKATLGTFNVAAIVDDVSIKGEGEKHITLSSPHLSALNQQLCFITYTSTVFHPRTADVVQFGTEGHQSFFTIKIGHKSLPKLYNSGAQAEYNISALVTIATKTFLRYEKLKDLIDSIRQYYPTVTIVIADDNQHPQPVTEPYIEHYIMPYKKGWFAGRNLAVSQVTTKYVLWVDDDFYFTENTKLEKMVDILERTTLDLVGGAVREVTGYTATYRHTISVEDGDEEGDCIHIRHGHHHDLHGFPNCVVADAVINFFMGRTEKVQEVGFNPRLARHAHLEFFIDGLGILHIGSCSDVIVNHASKIKLPWMEKESEKTYANFRYSSSSQDNSLYNEIFYFHSRFKCMTSQ